MLISRAVLLAAVAACVAACSHVVPATPHAPSSADQITLYQAQPPKTYEILGVVTDSSSDVKYGEGFTADGVVNNLKDKAAVLGANGLLLTFPDEQLTKTPTEVQVGGRYKGTWYVFSMDTDKGKTVMAKAIYVVDK
jgi:hypothetical protein